MKKIICIAIAMFSTFSIVNAQDPLFYKPIEVQVLNSSDLASRFLFQSREKAASGLEKFKDQVVSQIGATRYEEMLDGLAGGVFPCPISIFCNLGKSDSVGIRLSALRMQKIGEYIGTAGKVQAIVQLTDVPETWTKNK